MAELQIYQDCGIYFYQSEEKELKFLVGQCLYVSDINNLQVNYKVVSKEEVAVQKGNKSYVGQFEYETDKSIALRQDGSEDIIRINDPDTIQKNFSYLCKILSDSKNFKVAFKYNQIRWQSNILFSLDTSTLILKAKIFNSENLNFGLINSILIAKNYLVNSENRYSSERSFADIQSSKKKDKSENLNLLKYQIEDLILEQNEEINIILDEALVEADKIYVINLNYSQGKINYILKAPFDLPVSNIDIVSDGTIVGAKYLNKQYSRNSNIKIEVPLDLDVDLKFANPFFSISETKKKVKFDFVLVSNLNPEESIVYEIIFDLDFEPSKLSIIRNDVIIQDKPLVEGQRYILQQKNNGGHFRIEAE